MHHTLPYRNIERVDKVTLKSSPWPTLPFSGLRFSFLLWYTSNSAYKLLNKLIPLPGKRLLKKLNSSTIDRSKALCTLRYKSLFGNDVVIQLDEYIFKLKSNSMEKCNRK
ncbi:hypothetical protein LOD99_12045 [Oopsacas minuta]|uniref:Uncharacterized protein n=1 Tax=Oopsacas minuta TaxID=111878 RepID=A0AAV7JI99_9METZ|nr:hypothetical protein LOD99_12045 [Oopsacas minuta]